MKLLKKKCKWSFFVPLIFFILSFVANVILALYSHNLKIQLEIAKEPQPTKEIEVLADSRKINDKYETQASIKIANLGLRREKEFKFIISLPINYEIVKFDCESVTDEFGDEKNSRTYMATLWGRNSIKGTLIFRSHMRYFRGEKAHNININW